MNITRNDLKRIFELENYDLEDVLECSPYLPNELRSIHRHQNLMIWRDLAMCWMWLDGNSLATCGKAFNRDHSTCIHSIKKLVNAMDGFGLAELKSAALKVRAYARKKSVKTPDIYVNEMIGNVLLENEISRLIKNM